MITYDEHGNMISDDGKNGFNHKDPHNPNFTSNGETNDANSSHNGQEPSSMTATNIISPQFEQARQIVATELGKKGYPVAGAALAAATYGLEILFSNDNKVSKLFDFSHSKGGGS